MCRSTHRWSLWLLLTVLLAVRPASAAQPGVDRWLPPQAVLVVQVQDPKPWLDLALDRALETVKSIPGSEKLTANPGLARFQQVVEAVAKQLGTDWRTGLRTLTGGGITVALVPRQTGLVAVDATDPKMLAKLGEIVTLFATAGAGKNDRVTSVEYQGVTCWSLGDRVHYAILDGRLLASNRLETIQAALDLRAKPDGASLAAMPEYQAAKKSAGSAAGERAAAWAYLNVALLKQIPKIDAALTRNTNPLATLLGADLTEALHQSHWLALRAELQGQRLSLAATIDGAPAGSDATSGFASPRGPGAGAWPNLDVPRRLAAVSLYRDLSGFYANKERLFPERTSGLVFFENMMAIFFTGRDLAHEVLAEVEPEVRLVAAQQQYEASAGKPEVEVPAFAAVFRIKHPQQFGEVAEEAWQKALGLANFTRGQKAQPGLILDKADHRDVRYSLAYFSTAEEQDKSRLDTRFNFRPTLVKLGDYLVLSSTDGLAKDLIDTIKKETDRPPQALAAAHSLVEVDANVLAAMLKANREPLVRDSMLKKGQTHEQAEAQFELVLNLLQRFRGARLTVDSPAGQTRALLELDGNF